MYPFIRQAKEFWLHRNAPDLDLLDTHVSHHRCWPQDIDIYMEMNNGRVLTLLDLGRTILANRVGLIDILRNEGWGLTMAGVSVRYRKRITTFQKFEMRSRALGWDDRFFYLDQSMWQGDTCCNQALYRSAVTDHSGIVAPSRVFEKIAHAGISPPLPDWVENWIDAEATRTWPPARSDTPEPDVEELRRAS